MVVIVPLLIMATSLVSKINTRVALLKGWVNSFLAFMGQLYLGFYRSGRGPESRSFQCPDARHEDASCGSYLCGQGPNPLMQTSSGILGLPTGCATRCTFQAKWLNTAFVDVAPFAMRSD